MKTGHCQLHKDFCQYSLQKKKTCLNHRLITAIEVCQLAARRRIQCTDTGTYTPAQKGPTIIVLVMCIFRSQNQLPSQPEIQTSTSELGKCRVFCVSKWTYTQLDTFTTHGELSSLRCITLVLGKPCALSLLVVIQ